MAIRLLRRTHKYLKKLVYLMSKLHDLQAFLVEMAHIVNSITL